MLFGGSVASGWTYTNSQGTTKTVTSEALYDGGSLNTPSYYTSTSNITISSGQTIEIIAKKVAKPLTPSLKIKYSEDQGSSWKIAKEYNDTYITSTSESNTLTIDDFSGDYYLQFELGAVSVSSIVVKNYVPYPTPTAFTLNTYSSTSATFSWTAGRDELSWKFAYSTNPEFSPNPETATSITTNPYTLGELSEGTTYYACICADYGDSHYSEWTEKVAFTPRNETTLTIYDGTKENSWAPLNGSKVGNITYSQLIIPSSEISSIQGRQITKLTFYAKEASVNWGAAKFEVYLKETSTSAFPTSPELQSWGTNVYNNGSLSVSNNKMEIYLHTPFNYKSGNLLIGIKQTVVGTNGTVTWYGSDTYTAGIGLNLYDNTNTRVSYPRKVTFSTTAVSTAPVKIGATGFTTFSSAWPLDLSSLPDGLTAYYASSQDGSYVTLTKATTEVSAGTGLVLKGTAGQTYAIPVAASGSNISGNLLVGVTSETAVDASASKYVLVNNGGTAEFQSLEDNGATIPAGKAYLNTAGASARLSILFDDNDNTATSIKTTKTIDKTNIIYNLMGQKVKGSKPGLYIKNGKKVVMK